MAGKQINTRKHFIAVLALLLSSVLSSYAQVDKIALALEDNNLKRALKLAENSSEDPQYKKNPEVYFLMAETYYRIMEDEFLSTKYPDALKYGIKALEKGRSRADGDFFPEYMPLVDKYVEKNNEQGHLEYRINKYTKAVKTYQTSYDLNGDMKALYWVGKNWLMMEDTLTGEPYFNKVVAWSNEESAEGNDVNRVMIDPYVYFANKYWVKEQYDSANMYLEAGRKVFGSDDQIDYFLKQVTKQQIADLPPSSLMMEKLKRILTYFPTDTFFVKKENALYLYLLRNSLDQGDVSGFDTMLAHFVIDKTERAVSKDYNKYKQYDQFIDKKPENVVWKLVKYYSKFDHATASNHLANAYINSTASDTTDEARISRYAVIIDYSAKSYTLKLANQLLVDAEDRYGSIETFTNLRKSLISKSMSKELSTSEQGALYQLLIDDNVDLSKIDETVQEKIVDYAVALVRDKDYATARTVLERHRKAQPDIAMWDDKLEYLMKQDFYYSYYMTRVKEEVVAGQKVGGFNWDGSTAMCEEGSVPDDIQQKVEDRINYFRRQARVPEIFLDPELNGWCQKAALMMESNKSLSHEPDSRWSCYSDEGAHAARYSLLSKGANTTIAVTSFFADNQNPSVGNRRWLLYPNGLALGHGSTENACAIWASDDSGSVDTNHYKEAFVAWPPEGKLPKMMVFKYWSFSIDQKLSGAKVEMTIDNNPVAIKLLEFEAGHRLPTLVWLPEYDFKTVTDKLDVEVSVTLTNGRRYKYTVEIRDFDPIGY